MAASLVSHALAIPVADRNRNGQFEDSASWQARCSSPVQGVVCRQTLRNFSLSRRTPKSSKRTEVVAKVHSATHEASTVRTNSETVCPLSARPSICLQSMFSFPESCPDSKTLDRWVEGAVVEIVKNLQDAPFLHFVFDSNSSLIKSERCKVSEELFGTPDCWNYVKKSLFDVAPDGLIVVHRLDQGTAGSVREATAAASLVGSLPGCHMQDGLCLRNSNSFSRVAGDSGGTTDVWGVLVQGKSIGWSACYILQTTRIAVSGGAACTRFCLTRAQCFGPSVQAQLEKMWLL